MRTAIGVALALVLGVAPVTAGCGSTKAPREAAGPEMEIRDFQVIWTRGGRLGYLKTYDVSAPNGPHARVHWVENLQFKQLGWIGDDGQGARYDYGATREAEARRIPFEAVTLPVDSLENQIKRILQVDPRTEIALQRATEADLRK